MSRTRRIVQKRVKVQRDKYPVSHSDESYQGIFWLTSKGLGSKTPSRRRMPSATDQVRPCVCPAFEFYEEDDSGLFSASTAMTGMRKSKTLGRGDRVHGSGFPFLYRATGARAHPASSAQHQAYPENRRRAVIGGRTAAAFVALGLGTLTRATARLNDASRQLTDRPLRMPFLRRRQPRLPRRCVSSVVSLLVSFVGVVGDISRVKRKRLIATVDRVAFFVRLHDNCSRALRWPCALPWPSRWAHPRIGFCLDRFQEQWGTTDCSQCGLIAFSILWLPVSFSRRGL